MQKKLLSLMSVMLLSGCATMQHQAGRHDQDYLTQGQSISVTQVPPAMNALPMQNYYTIPSVPAAGNSLRPAITPPGFRVPQQTATQAVFVKKGTIVTASSSNTLVLNASYTKAWSQVGQALRSSGYKVMQQDKSMGVYYVLDLAGSGGVLKTTTPIYRVNVTETGATTRVNVVDAKNNPADVSVSSRILGALKQKL